MCLILNPLLQETLGHVQGGPRRACFQSDLGEPKRMLSKLFSHSLATHTHTPMAILTNLQEAVDKINLKKAAKQGTSKDDCCLFWVFGWLA